MRAGNDYPEVAVEGGLKSNSNCAGVAHIGRDLAADCRHGGQGAEGLTGGSRAVVIDPGLRELAGFAGYRSLRSARRPETEFGSLGRVRVGTGYIDHQGIRRYLHVGGNGEAAAVLDQG